MNAVEFLKQLVEEIEKMENSGQVNTEKQEKPAIILTEQQKTAIRGRIAEGYLWVITSKGMSKAYFFDKKPIYYNEKGVEYTGNYTSGDRCFYHFLTEDEFVYLPDLLVGEE